MGSVVLLIIKGTIQRGFFTFFSFMLTAPPEPPARLTSAFRIWFELDERFVILGLTLCYCFYCFQWRVNTHRIIQQKESQLSPNKFKGFVFVFLKLADQRLADSKINQRISDQRTQKKISDAHLQLFIAEVNDSSYQNQFSHTKLATTTYGLCEFLCMKVST